MRFRFTVAVVAVASLGFALSAGADESTKANALMNECKEHEEAPSEAYEACSQLLKTDDLSEDDRFSILLHRGTASLVVDQHAAATQDYTEALEIKPDSGLALTARAFAFIKIGELERAEQDNAKALKLDPENEVSLFNVARIEISRGDIEAAIRATEKVLDVDPDNTVARENLLKAHYETGGLQRLYDFLERAKERWPDQSWVHYSIMFIHMTKAPDLDAALLAAGEYTKAIGNADAPLVFAWVHLQIGDEETGKKIIRELAIDEWAEELRESYNGRLPLLLSLKYELSVLAKENARLIAALHFDVVDCRDLAMQELDLYLDNAGDLGKKFLLKQVELVLEHVDHEEYNRSQSYRTEVHTRYFEAKNRSDRFPETSHFRMHKTNH